MRKPSPNPLMDGDLDIDFLHEIASRMALAPPLHEVLRELVRFTAAVVDCDSCFVYVLEKDELVLRASKNPHPEIIDRLKLKIGEGITGWVAEHREPVAVALNAMKDPRFKFFNDLPEDQFEAFLSVPLVCRGRLVGVINLQNRKPHNYNKREISLISTVGALVGAEIEMARLQDEERRRIGREVHDSLGQELTAAKLYLRRIPEHSYADAQWSSFVKEAAGAVDRALQQVRSLSYLLHPPFAEDMGLLDGGALLHGRREPAHGHPGEGHAAGGAAAAALRDGGGDFSRGAGVPDQYVPALQQQNGGDRTGAQGRDGAREDPGLRREASGGKGGR